MLSQSQIKAAWAPPCRGPWVQVEYPGQGRVSVRPAAAEAFRAKAMVYAAFGYITRRADTGGYVCRTTATGGSSRHAEGIADDTNWTSNPQGSRTITDRPPGMNQAIVAIRTNNGKQVFNNGIFWSGTPDVMHDEIVCAPVDLAHGIDYSTVARAAATKPPATPPPPYIPPTPTIEFLLENGDPVLYLNHPEYGDRIVVEINNKWFDVPAAANTPKAAGIPTASPSAAALASMRAASGMVGL